VARIATKKVRSVFRCQHCGHSESKWLGRCPGCSEWNCLIEERATEVGRAAAAVPGDTAGPVSIAEVSALEAGRRLTCGIAELDRVLGGGLVPGSLVLLGGEPGIGKSTLLIQLMAGIAADAGRSRPLPVLYVSGEESVAQTALRARRVGADRAELRLLAETNLERILHHARSERPAVLAIDSIQTVQTDALDSIPGSVGQVRECAGMLLHFAKSSGIPTVLVGHVTKEGAIAGPKTLEHVVDAVLQFEGDGASPYRIVRALKNRFGSTQEIGVFEMHGAGLREVGNPSELFLSERPLGVPGSVVVASAEGSRPILVEVQALVAPAAAGFGRRTAAGVDGNRLSLLLAVLAQRANLDVLSQDVFVNVAGGVRLAEPAIDLGVACAVASAARKRAVDPATAVFGELGLAGEVRAVNLTETRLAEAVKLGFRRCILPEQNRSRIGSLPGLELLGVRNLLQALDAL
jgi:DNA repair protein RadA/Sms